MSGYYPGTYGFENDKIGTLPSFGHNFDLAGGKMSVIEELDGHHHILELNDNNSASRLLIINNITATPTHGTIEFWMRTNDTSKHHSYNCPGNSLIYPTAFLQLSIENDVWRYSNGPVVTDVPNVPIPQNNTWHRISIHFRCGGAPTYQGLSDNKWKVIIDSVDSGELNPRGTTHNYITQFNIKTAPIDEGYSVYIDAVGYSWDPNYNIGDNVYEGLLLSFENSTALNWTGYSLDYQPMKTILGNTTFPMPENGIHTIQVFGNDSFGTNYSSEIRYFTVDYHPLKIITPENKTYTEPMSGYYPATYGFENDDNGVFPFGWIDDSFGSALVTIEEEKSGHKKVIKSYDPAGSSRAQANQSFSPQLSGSIEFWFLKEAGGTGSPVQIIIQGDNGAVIHLLIDDSLNGNTFYESSYGEFAAGKYSDDQWFHIKIDLICSTDKYDLYLDGVKEIDQGDFDNTQNWFHYFYISSSNSRTGIYYIDALGYSWDPNYNIGDNLNEGLLLSFENSTNLDWMGYSLDSQTKF
jgi:hypothetical protein